MSGLLEGFCPEVQSLHAAGVLADLDVYLVESLLRVYGKRPAAVQPAAQVALVLASRVVASGHTCLELQALTPEWVAGLYGDRADADFVLPAGLVAMCAQLRAGDGAVWAEISGTVVGAPAEGRPFVLSRRRLYLRRYWDYESRVAVRLREMAVGGEVGAARIAASVDQRVDELLADADQRKAARMALTRRLTVITGGPGTGKTFTAARILALLAKAALDSGRTIRVRMAAPTGKAAARMDESVRAAARGLAEHGIALPANMEPACTLERLLGYRGDSPYFRHNADNPLDADVVLVDEASMLDLPKMAKLLDALGASARLVLLGDMHQLASVEVGCVLAGICGSSDLRAVVVNLAKSHRFGEGSALGALNRAVNEAVDEVAAGRAWAMLTAGGVPALAQSDVPESLVGGDGAVAGDFAKRIREGYGAFLNADGPADAFAALGQFRVLCAMRHGPLGALRVNKLIRDVLAMSPGAAEPVRLRRLAASGELYSHRVIMVTRNDYAMRLFNGDVGLVLPDPACGNELRVFFDRATDAGGVAGGEAAVAYRSIPPRLLPEHETAFAMTVHKSQGSEFEKVLVVMPRNDHPILTRELIYTALTRARSGVDVWCTEDVFKRSVQRRVVRFSGMHDALSGAE